MVITNNVRDVVAENVKRLRVESDKSVIAASAEIGVHRSWWNMLENGTLNFTIEKLEKVASALGVSVRDLLEPSKSSKGRKAS